MVALVIPVGAEIYWAIKVWRSLGFANLYTLAVIGYGVLWPLMAWVLTTLEKTDKKQAPNDFGDASELVAEILLRPHPCGHGCPCLQLRKVERIDEAIRKLHLQKLKDGTQKYSGVVHQQIQGVNCALFSNSLRRARHIERHRPGFDANHSFVICQKPRQIHQVWGMRELLGADSAGRRLAPRLLKN